MADEGVQTSEPESQAWDRAKRFLLAAVGAIALGLGLSGAGSAQIGGVLVVVGWLVAVGALHRLGRAGSARGGPTSRGAR